MGQHASNHPLELLAPKTAGDRHAMYTTLRDVLTGHFPSRGATVRGLALAAVRYLDGDGPRVVLRGPRGAGKRDLIRTLVAVLQVPSLEIDVPSLAETNWSGSDVPHQIDQLRTDLSQKYPPNLVPELTERACILVTNLDSGRLGTAYTSSASRDHQRGKQLALAQLFRGDPIPIAPERGQGFVWRGERALVVATAEWDDLRSARPSAVDLESWGLLPALADAIAAGVIIPVEPPTRTEVEMRLRSVVSRLVARFTPFGFNLRVEEQVITFVAASVGSGVYGGGIAAGASWIAAAVEAAVIRRMDDGESGLVVLARDDLTLPDAPTGVWRE